MNSLSFVLKNADMKFIANCLAFSCVFFVGLAVGSAVKMFLPAKERLARYSLRFVYTCVFLSASAVLYTILVFYEKNITWFLVLGKNNAYYFLFLLGILLFATLLVVFWKILLPVSIVLYVSLSFLTQRLLQDCFGEQKNFVSFSVDEKSLMLGNEQFHRREDVAPSLLVKNCTLPDFFVLPIRRNWHSVEFSNLSTTPAENSDDFVIGTDDDFLSMFPPSNLLKYRLCRDYVRLVVFEGRGHFFKIPVPDAQVYPALFSVHIFYKAGAYHCELVREI